MERIQKIIANRGYCSRRKAEELIGQGKVKVDGIVIRELGIKISEQATIEVENKVVEYNEKEYILLNKPRGVVTTTSDDKQRKTVIDLIATNKRLYPIGRLDYDTTGILLLTNDGELTNMLTHPSNNIDKVYIAKINGIMSGESIHRLESGIVIDGKKTAKAKIKIRKKDHKTKSSIVELTIHEGKNHQVKRMFEAVGYQVDKLKRERIAFLDVKGLKSGEYRYLNPKEVKKLYNLSETKKQ